MYSSLAACENYSWLTTGQLFKRRVVFVSHALGGLVLKRVRTIARTVALPLTFLRPLLLYIRNTMTLPTKHSSMFILALSFSVLPILLSRIDTSGPYSAQISSSASTFPRPSLLKPKSRML